MPSAAPGLPVSAPPRLFGECPPGPAAGFTSQYHRRRPEETLLHEVIRENYRSFVALCEEEARPLPAFVRKEFEKYLGCGVLSEGFARVHCFECGYDRLVAFTCKLRGFCP